MNCALTKYLLALPALALAATWLSCSGENSDLSAGTQGRVPLQIQTVGIEQTRALVEGETLPSGTEYGVFVTSNSVPSVEYLIANNRKVTYEDGISTMDSVVLIPEGGSAWVWAYYPYNAAHNATELNVLQLEAQSQTDYLVGRGDRAATESEPVVPVHMTHLMSRLHITVRNDSANTTDYPIDKVTVSNVNIAGQYEIVSYYSSQLVAEKMGSVTVEAKPAGTRAYTADILIFPTASNASPQLSLPGTQFLDIDLPRHNYDMGQQYNIDVRINMQRELTISNVWISKWQTVEKEGLQVFADDKIDDGTDPTPMGDYEAVDLGLSVKWATMNVGASKPEDCGDYFAWGETEPKEDYSYATYKWCNGSGLSLTKYCHTSVNGIVDNKTFLEAEDDAATVNWGSKWRMPTRAEWGYLRDRCSWTWTTSNGVAGYQVTGSNGNSIFLPAAGWYEGTNLVFYDASPAGCYWSNTVRQAEGGGAYSFNIYSSAYKETPVDRCTGMLVRPVTE